MRLSTVMYLLLAVVVSHVAGGVIEFSARRDSLFGLFKRQLSQEACENECNAWLDVIKSCDVLETTCACNPTVDKELGNCVKCALALPGQGENPEVLEASSLVKLYTSSICSDFSLPTIIVPPPSPSSTDTSIPLTTSTSIPLPSITLPPPSPSSTDTSIPLTTSTSTTLLTSTPPPPSPSATGTSSPSTTSTSTTLQITTPPSPSPSSTETSGPPTSTSIPVPTTSKGVVVPSGAQPSSEPTTTKAGTPPPNAPTSASTLDNTTPTSGPVDTNPPSSSSVDIIPASSLSVGAAPASPSSVDTTPTSSTSVNAILPLSLPSGGTTTIPPGTLGPTMTSIDINPIVTPDSTANKGGSPPSSSGTILSGKVDHLYQVSIAAFLAIVGLTL